MGDSTPAEAVRKEQQKDTQRLVERLGQISIPDLAIHYTLEKSSVVLPGLLIRLVALSVLFRLNSAKKWRLVLEEESLPEPARRWLGIEDVTELIERATVDWIPPRLFVDTLAWQVVQCLTRCGAPQPMAVVRQTIRDLLLRDATPSPSRAASCWVGDSGGGSSPGRSGRAQPRWPTSAGSASSSCWAKWIFPKRSSGGGSTCPS